MKQTKKDSRSREILYLLSAGKIVAIKSYDGKDATYILFSDKKTFIKLSEQDSYAFQDCSSIARYIEVYQNADEWKTIMKNRKDAKDLT